MLQMLYPETEAVSTYEIDFKEMYQRGIRGILFDVDNTLVPHGAPADERAIRLFAMLHETGLKTCLISNNKEPRVKPFADAVGTIYICNAHKPSASGYQDAINRMGITEAETLFVGDQIFTDIFGANRAGIHTCLVHPIHPKEEIQIVLKRYLEKIVLYFYHRRK